MRVGDLVPRSAQAETFAVLGEVDSGLLKNVQEFRGPTLSLCAGQRQALCASQGENGEFYCV